jgi:hypothetical protein
VPHLYRMAHEHSLALPIRSVPGGNHAMA